MTEQMAVEIVRKEKAYMDSHAGKAQSEAFDMAIKALEEIQQYRALGTVEELMAKNEKLQGYRNQMSIYAEQHKIILASDVLDMLEELE